MGTGIQTPYPQIAEVQALKEPYDRLWKAAVKFHALYDRWMHGPMLEVDAEEVEEEVTNLWKTAYKLTKVSVDGLSS